MEKQAFTKLAADMAQYVQDSQELLTDLQTENEALRKQAASEQKEASASPAFETDGLENMVDNLVAAGLLKEAARQESLDAMAADPNVLVNYVDRLAVKSMENKQAAAEVRPLGKKTKKDTQTQKEASVRESDQAFEQLVQRLRTRI